MAITEIGGLLPWPTFGAYSQSTLGFTSTTFVIGAASEKIGVIFCIPKTGSISKLLFRTATVTTGATLDVRLETVDLTTGLPSGTLYATDTNGSQVVADGDDNVLFETTLTAAASVTVGDLVAIVVSNPAASFGNMQIAALTGNVLPPFVFPYGASYASSWAKATANVPMIAGLEYDDGSYEEILGLNVVSSLTATNFNSGSSPNHRALRFQVPIACRVQGLWVNITSVGDFDLILAPSDWDGTNGDSLARVVVDKDVDRNAVNGAFHFPIASVDLAAATTYFLVVKPTSATNVTFQEYSVDSAAQLDANGGTSECYLATATAPNDLTDWTTTTTSRPFMGVLLSGFDVGAGGGGLLTNPGMGGGMRN